MKKRIMAILAVLFLLPAAGCGKGKADTEKKEADEALVGTAYTETDNTDYVFCAESGSLKLYFCPNTTHFKVENTADGSVWCSSPEDFTNETASKLIQMRMSASLVINYTDVEADKSGNINSYTGSVKSGDYKIETVTGGVRFIYHFSEIDAYITLEARLEGGALVTELDTDKITVGRENVKVTDISILPYFLCGTAEDDGYLFLADGSGALVRFNDSVKSTALYSRRIYGSEPTDITSDAYLRIDDEAVRLPVWGVVRNGAAVMAIAEGGAADGYLNAAACGQISTRANAYASYKLVNSVTHELGQYETEVYDKLTSTIGKITTSYYFLSGDKADYSGMAESYRSYLISKCGMTEGKYNSGVYLDAYGGVKKTVSVMGVPHEKAIALTTAEQLEEITEALKNAGLEDLTVRYRNWSSKELFGKKVSSASAAKSVISQKELSRLSADDGVRLYPALLDVHTYSDGNYFGHILKAAYSVTGLPFSWYGYSISTLNDTDTVYYRNALSRMGTLTDKLFKSVSGNSLEKLALGDASSALYCDFKGDGYRRTDCAEVMTDILKKASDSVDSLMLESANAYALPYADVVYSVPVCHSGHEILDESVPFYAMAISGLTEYAAPAVNSSNVGDDIELYTAVSGAGVSYALIYENAEKLKDTDLNGMFGASWQQNSEQITELLTRFNALSEKTAESRIVKHKWLENKLSVTLYSNGSAVYANFGSEAVTLEDGQTLAGGEFTVVREEAR